MQVKFLLFQVSSLEPDHSDVPTAPCRFCLEHPAPQPCSPTMQWVFGVLSVVPACSLSLCEAWYHFLPHPHCLETRSVHPEGWDPPETTPRPCELRCSCSVAGGLVPVLKGAGFHHRRQCCPEAPESCPVRQACKNRDLEGWAGWAQLLSSQPRGG